MLLVSKLRVWHSEQREDEFVECSEKSDYTNVNAYRFFTAFRMTIC